SGTPVLQLRAKDAGLVGESIRAKVTYNGPQPEATFNIDLFRWDVDSSGRRNRVDQESWRRLSMDPSSAAYAQDFLTQNSKLVDAFDIGPTGVDGFSLSGRPVDDTPGFQVAWQTLLGNNIAATTNRFQITVGGHGPVMVDLSGVAVAATVPPTETA